jgi:hypothetical protein
MFHSISMFVELSSPKLSVAPKVSAAYDRIEPIILTFVTVFAEILLVFNCFSFSLFEIVALTPDY